MKKALNTNWFWIIVIITTGLILEFTTNFNGLFLLAMVGVWIGTVFYHECGHWFFAKTRKMELFMISSFAGMYMNGRWYFSIPAYISWGVCGMYKPLRNGRMSKTDAIWYISGGMIFNLAAVLILIGIKYTFNIENEILNFTILMNGLIMIATAIPTKNNDGGRLLSILRGKEDELEVFNSSNFLFSPELSAEEIFNEISLDNENDYMATYVRNLAYMEKESHNDFKNIYETELTERHEINKMVIEGFQAMYKYADGEELDSHEIEIFNEQASVYTIPFSRIYQFFKTGEIEHLVYFEKHNSHFPGELENKVFLRALEGF
ncbi:hypothetical protein [Salinicoccus sp. YB14-2]|uniref:hypothetical protein n=1 Tax=Salinicoccus sp. YB14-2 TaxID=1572701 RepID=UPI00068DF164|nr:hypothetical protein [Salinicoccus sp. YB14-2]